MKFLLLFILLILAAPVHAATETINFSATTDAWDNLSSDSQRYIARKFTPAANSSSLVANFGGKALLSPNGNLVIGIMADSAGEPSETYLASVTMSAATLGTNAGGCNDKTSSTITYNMVGGTSYWLVFGRDGDYTIGYYQICDKFGLSTSAYHFKNYGTGLWSTISTGDLYGSIVLTQSAAGFNWQIWSDY